MMVNNTGILFSTLVVLSNNLSDFRPNDTSKSPTADPDSAPCYGMFDCFPITFPWTSVRRPISLFPEDPSKINATFAVFNSQNMSFPKYIDIDDPETVHRAGINPDGLIYFITHGFLERGSTLWIKQMLEALLERDPDATVIVIDWGNGSKPPYNQACANIRVVGTFAAHVIEMIMHELNLPDLDKVHMIGHSLGSHLSGYAGYTLRANLSLHLGRITGLDPAELAFSETNEIVRLDPSDAKFVDIVHSDATPFVSNIGLGLHEPIGHVDFYPNGGFNQPGCQQDLWKHSRDRFVSNVFHFLSCSHSRSYKYFIESIKTPMVAVACDSYEKYQSGQCFDCTANDARCVEFGLNSSTGYNQLVLRGRVNPLRHVPLQLFFKTNPSEPFLTQNFKITVKISDSARSLAHGPEIGKILLYLHGLGDAKPKQIYFNEEPILFEPGREYSSILTAYGNGRPKSISVGYEHDMNLLNPFTWRLFTASRIYIEHVMVFTHQSLTQRIKLRMCPTYDVPVTTNDFIVISDLKCKPRNRP
ncbi:pancreatic triacylglycerol lipase-like [Anopheles nili]|uniref:pancreatic triacylglycerol lipase-like n=1 Tax=Anopheles nili TaxID=185578 RepID=UPI00237B71C4|nr:pancreatic triacylglycerol lipase-like [Anopheles nili]